MHALGELANTTWLRLEDLLKDFDDIDEKREVFINDTRQFFEKRLSMYQQQRNELENHVKKLLEQMYQLFDELKLPRIIFDDNQITLKEKRILINEKIDQLKNMIFERDKEFIQLKKLINIKIKLIGNIQINIEEVRIYTFFISLFQENRDSNKKKVNFLSKRVILKFMLFLHDRYLLFRLYRLLKHIQFYLISKIN